MWLKKSLEGLKEALEPRIREPNLKEIDEDKRIEELKRKIGETGEFD